MKVGVFDSGLGGLTILDALLSTVKDAEFYYIADTLHAPYGAKTPEQIVDYSFKITQYLLKHFHIDALVVACNTATAFAIEALRDAYPQLIIVGTEPGLKPAIEQTKSKSIGIMATQATLKAEKYKRLLAGLLADKEPYYVYEQACVGLVEQIEAGEIESEKTLAMLDNWLSPMREGGVDTIVLGCTHYPLVEKQIQSLMPKNTTLIHTGEAIANRLLSLRKEPAGNKNLPSVKLFCTGKLDEKMAHKILKKDIRIEKIEI